ncbi:helix-turn-helix domain-containing protein [Paenibacillus sp. UMB4589-SE434]|uniref:GH39 family glycosyl hydrolase n=1 Tax=Paenibacillus sp. UMB4589-SE434 TaxID=3046314 RepID=UPI00254F4AA8|nr:helix-turn-helix domain-containing protein [Paenibacillus sp. UMB4589-SE434]MDK8179758.1 helix-turn-helix domain-containing protein [Paenibacillus sp. UMB4589-SE434]
MSYLYEFIDYQEDLPIRLFVNSVAYVPFHWHKEVEIIYVLQGAITMHLDQQSYTLNQDDIIVVNSMSVHQIEHTNQDNVLLTLQFSPELLDEHMLVACNSLYQTPENRNHYDRIRCYLAQMAWEASKKTQGSRNYSMGLLYMLAGHLMRFFSRRMTEEKRRNVKDYDYQRLNRVLQFIDRHYSQKITLQSIADQEHLSLHYFSHFFSDKIGIPFQKYLTTVRLEKAVDALINTNLSMTQIALDCGFANVKLFNKYFKEKYDTTPGVFRESIMESKSADPTRKPLTYEESTSADYYEVDTIQAMESLYRYLETSQESFLTSSTENVIYNQMEISVNLKTAGIPYMKHWNWLTTAGRAVEGLRADWQSQLLELQRNLKFSHIRFHGIFNDEMMVYAETEEGEPIFNWAYVDKLYDFLLKADIRPFVALSFMPSVLARSNETIFWWRGHIAPPKDQNKWNALVREFVFHCLNRYGMEEVSTWYFEVWNEPDLSGVCWAGTKQEYFEFYAETASAIKSISSKFRVGGPAMGYGSVWNDNWADEFIAFCSERQIPIDFFSFHVYSEYPNQKSEKDKLTTLMPPSFYLDSVKRLRSKLTGTDISELELHMTEWNFSLYDRNLIHDTMFMGAFVVHHVLQTLGTLKSIAFWSFTDVFEESLVPSSIFYGGFGLINRNGLKKPSYHAFELLTRLGDCILAQGDGYIVTSARDGCLQILMYNYTHVDQLFASGDWSGLTETSRYTIFEEKGNCSFKLNLDGQEHKYKMTSYRLDREHGSVFDEWICLGAPTYPTEEELQFLRNRSVPEIHVEWLDAVGQLERTFIIPSHGILLITLQPQY